MSVRSKNTAIKGGGVDKIGRQNFRRWESSLNRFTEPFCGLFQKRGRQHALNFVDPKFGSTMRVKPIR